MLEQSGIVDITSSVVETIPIKRKKGRPRKEVVLTDVKEEVKEKKKRGRKKKPVTENEDVKKKKKRGRKAAVKYFSSSIRKKIPLTTYIQDTNNYILHLDIKEEDNKNDNNLINDKNSIYDDILFKTLEEKNYEYLSKENESDKEESDNEESDNEESDNEESDDSESDKEESDKEESDDNESNISDEDNLKELYKSRIQFREKQDKNLINKLEKLHKDDEFINKVYNNFDKIQENDIKENKDKVDEINEQEHNKKMGYFELLYKFIHNEEWIEKTDICCWWCCHKFDSIPIGLPVYYCKIKNKFRVKGVFCSFACMIAYNNNEYNNKSSHKYLINFLYKKLTGVERSISGLSAPPRSSLKCFGGELTIEEFRQATEENKIYKMVEYPMFMSRDYIEEVDIANLKNANVKIFNENTSSTIVKQSTNKLDDKRVEDAKFRLSQIETTVTLGNTIDKFLKISN